MCVRERERESGCARAYVCVYDGGFTRSLKFVAFGKIEGLQQLLYIFFFNKTTDDKKIISTQVNYSHVEMCILSFFGWIITDMGVGWLFVSKRFN